MAALRPHWLAAPPCYDAAEADPTQAGWVLLADDREI